MAMGLAMLALPALAPYDPRLSVAAPLQAPSMLHVLGTNDIGQDVLSQWLFAARASLLMALAVTALASTLAWSVGILAGLSARAEGVAMAVTDLLLALPALPLYVLVLTLIGPSQLHIALLLALLGWPTFARVVRAQVLSVRGAPYVEAARCLGAAWSRVALVHVLPATLTLLPANLVLTVRLAVFAEATLAFLGLGDSAQASWGTMLGWAFANPLLFTSNAWLWLVLPPACGIGLLIMAAAYVGTLVDRRPVILSASAQRPGPTVTSGSWLPTPGSSVSRLSSSTPRPSSPFLSPSSPAGRS
jgi:ABC-type dipeptide/oligopeptide/nickel transport system permease subunit